MSTTDMLVETIYLPIKDLPPDYEPHCGWRLMTGNLTHNEWARVVYQYELEDGE